MEENKNPRAGRFIPWYIVAFFAGQTVLFSWFIHVAMSTHTGLVTEQAYEKGLAYNKTIENARQQELLGFTSDIIRKDKTISFTLKDKNGAVIRDASVNLYLFRPVQEGLDAKFPLSLSADNSYQAEITPPLQGLWEVRIHARTPQGNYQTSKRMVFE